MSNTLTERGDPPIMQTGLSIFDNGTFEGISRVADAMAHSPLVPESLRTKKENGKAVDLPLEQVRANCFLICEQSARWGISPFAALACASNIHGRLMWEGKLVAGVLEAKLGVRLDYQYEGAGDKMTVTVKGTLPGETKERTVNGNVADWKTDQWKQSAYEQRLAYRGAREWARRHAPSIMLGVITEDEITPELRDVTPRGKSSLQETKIDPFETLPCPAGDKAETTPAPAAQEPETVTHPPEGRQQKARHETTGAFRSITEQSGNGKTWFDVKFLIKGKIVTLTTFSTSDAEVLRVTDKGTPMRIIAVKSGDGFALDSFSVATEPERSPI